MTVPIQVNKKVILLENLTPDTITIPIIACTTIITTAKKSSIPPMVANMTMKTGKKKPILKPVKKSCKMEDKTRAGSAANER